MKQLSGSNRLRFKMTLMILAWGGLKVAISDSILSASTVDATVNTIAVAPPTNDDLCNAISLTVNASCSGFIYTNVEATLEANEFDACGGESYHTVWFNFTAPASGSVTITSDPQTPANFERVVYAEGAGFSCSDLSTLSQVACSNDDSELNTLTACGLTPGNNYYIRIQVIPPNDGPFCLEVADGPAPASATLSGDNSICSGSSSDLTLNIVGGDSPFTVVYNDGTTDITINNYTSGPITVNPTVTTTYTLVSVSNSCGSAPSISGAPTITVSEAPQSATLSGDNTICAGESTDLNLVVVGGDSPFTVVYNDGTTDITINNYTSGPITVNPTVTATYTLVSVSNNCGSAASISGTATVTVNDGPQGASLGGGGTICSGESANIFFTIPNGTPPYTVVYSDGTTDFTVNNYASNDPISVSPAETTNYSPVSVTDANGCTGGLEGFADVIVNDGPQGASLGGGGTICSGESANIFFTIPNGTPPYTVVYSDGTTDFTVNNYASNDPISVSPAETTNYSPVSVTDANGCTGGLEGFADVIVNDGPQGASLGGGGTICSGESANIFFTIPNGTPPYTVVYSDGTTDFTVNNYASNDPISVSPAETTNYSPVSVTDANGCTGGLEGFADVIVNDGPQGASLGGGGTICSGESANIFFTIPNGTPPYTVVYSDGTTDFTVNNYASNDPISVSPAETTNYSPVSVTDANGCTGGLEGFADVIVNDGPQGASLGGGGTICSGESANIFFTIPNGTPPYTVVYSDGTTDFTVNNYASNDPISVSPAETTNYSPVSVTDANGCTGGLEGFADVIVNDGPQGASLGGGGTICSGESANIFFTIPNGTPPYTVVYSDGTTDFTVNNYASNDPISVSPAETTNYSPVSVTDANGCTGGLEGFADVIVNDGPQGASLGGGGTICSGESANIFFTIPNGTPPYTVVYSDGTTDFTVNNYASNDPISVSPAETTNYSPVSVTDANGCTGGLEGFADVIVNDGPQGASLGGGGTICSGESANIFFTIPNGTPPYTVVYSDGTTDFTVNNYASNDPISVSPAETTSYSPVSVTDANGCTGGLEGFADVIVNDGPQGASLGGGGTICSGESANIFFTIPNGTPPYTVVYSDGTTDFTVNNYASNDPIPVSPAETTSYSPVSVTDANGCTGGLEGFADVIVNDGPQGASLGGGGTICSGESANIFFTIPNGTPPYTVVYSDGTTDFTVNNYASNDPIPVSPAETTSYSPVSVTDANGCTGGLEGFADVIVNDGPQGASLGGGGTICSGESANIFFTIPNGTPPYTVVYSDGTTDFTVNNYASNDPIPVSPAETTSYSPVSVTDANGCTGGLEGFADVIVNPLPSLVVNGTSCSSDLTTYSVDLTTDGNTVTASQGSVVSNGGNSYTITGVPAASNVTITAEFTATGCQSQQTVEGPACNCPVIDPPISQGDQSICAGEAIPALSVSVGANQTADWYDSASGGTLLATGTTAYTPSTAGTYYAEARDVNNNCVSSTRTAVTLTINPLPSLVVNGTTCSSDLTTYSVDLTSDGNSVTASQGSLVSNGGNSYTITGVPAASNVTITAEFTATGCQNQQTVEGPACNCPVIDPPISQGDQSICAGETIPALSVSVGANQTADWYDSASGGTLLATGTTAYTPSTAGTYYAEARDVNNNCVSSTRTAVTLTINPLPSLVVNGTTCSSDLTTYNVDLTSDGNSVTASQGSLVSNGGNSYTITGVPAASNVTITAEFTATGCQNQQTVEGPACNCPVIDPPISQGDQSICAGEAIPALSVSVGANQTADWYDSASGGTLLATGTTAYTPSTAGTYYTEARDVNNNCVSSTRTAVTLTINPLPSLVVNGTTCSSDLTTYNVDLTSDGNSVTASQGSLVSNGGNSYTITGVPAASNVTITAEFTATGCQNQQTVEGPACNCPVIDPPISQGDQSICAGEAIPALSVSVGANQTADWYDSASGGTLLATGTTAYTPSTAGTYFAEARDVNNNCVSSTRTAVTLTINPLPSLVVNGTSCSSDLTTYSVDLTSDGNTVTASQGSLVSNGGNSYTITGVPAASNVTITAEFTATGCQNQQTVEGPACNCPVIDPPISQGDQSICAGEAIPALSVSVGADQTADWYDSASGGTLLATGTTAYTPSTAGTYFAEARDVNNNCVSSTRTAVTLAIFSLPTPTITGDLEFCTGSSTILDAGAGFATYQWSNGSDQPSLEVFEAGNYSVTVTDDNGCTGVDIVTITANNSPGNSSLSGGGAICEGEGVDLFFTIPGGTPPYTVVYTDGSTNFTINNYESGTPIPVSPVVTTNYSPVSVTDANGCTAGLDGSVTVNVNDGPENAILTGRGAICAGQSTNLFFFIFGGTAPFIVVYSDGTTDFTVNNYANGDPIPISPVTTTTYSPVSVTDANGCTGNLEGLVDITVIDGLGDISLEGGGDICAGQSSNMYFSIPDGAPPYTVVYSDGTTNFTLHNYRSEDPIPLSPVVTTTYSPVSIADANGCTGNVEGSVTVTVNDIPNLIVNDVSCSMDLNTYSVELTTNGDHVVASLGNVIFNGSPSYTITEIPFGLSVTITAENTASGCQVQQSVNAPDCACPAIDSPVAGPNQEICQGEAIPALTVSVGENQTADWYDAPSGGTLLATGTTVYIPSEAGLFYAEARDVNNGCVSSVRTAMTLNILPLPTTTITGDLEFCAGSSTLLDAGAGFVAYQWSNGAEGQSQEVFEAGDYSVTITDVNGCTAIDIVTVTVNDGPGNTSLEGGGDICVGESADLFFSIPGGAPPYTVVYSDGTTNFTVNNYSDGAPILVSPTVTTSYSPISVTDANGCTGGLDGFVTVMVSNGPGNTSLEGGGDICVGQSADLFFSIPGGAPPYTVVYSDGTTNFTVNNYSDGAPILVSPTVTTSYSPVSVTDANGCTGGLDGFVTVTVSNGPGNTSLEGGGDICTGDSANLFFSIPGGAPPYTVVYSDGTTNFTVNNYSDGAPIPVSPAVTTSYNPISVTDANGCTGGLDGFVTVTVSNGPGNTSLEGGGDICAGQSANLFFSIPGGAPPYTVVYSDGTTNFTVNNYSDGAPIPVSPAVTTSYNPISVTDANGCTGGLDGFVTVTVSNGPGNTSLEGGGDICAGQSANLFFSIPGGAPPYTVVYSNGTTNFTVNNYSDGAPIPVSPAVTTSYSPISVTDANGCTGGLDGFVTVTVSNGPGNTSLEGGGDICAGQSANLFFSIPGGAPPYTVVYSNGTTNFTVNNYSDGAPIPVSPAVTTSYSPISVTDANGCTGGLDGSVTVTVSNGPGNTNLEGGGDICVGESADLFFSIPGGAPPYTVVYSNGTTNFTVNNYSDGAPILVSPTVTTSYSPISVTDANGCTGGLDGFVTVTVIDPPSLIVNSVSCSTDLNTYSVELTTNGDHVVASLGNVIFNGSSSYTITEIPLGLSVTITAENTANGCQVQQSVNAPDCSCPVIELPVAGPNQEICQGEAIPALTVSVGENQTADWYDAPSGGTLLATGTTVYIPSEAGLFYAEARDVNDGCVSSVRTAMTLTIFPLPTTTITGDLEFCAGSSTLLDAGAGFVAYQWSNGSEGQSQEVFEVGDYSVTATDVNGCTAIDIVTVTVNDGPGNTSLEGGGDICAGDSADLFFSIPSGAPPYTVVYSDGTTNFTLNNYISGASISVSPAVTTSYSPISVTDANGCTGGLDGFVTITVSNGPGNTSLEGGGDICAGQSANLFFSIPGGAPPYTVVYSDGITNFTLNNYISGAPIPVSPAVTTSYSPISVTDANGCTGGLDGFVTVTVSNGPGNTSLEGGGDICVGESADLFFSIPGGASPYTVVYSDGTTNFTVNNYSDGAPIPVSPAVTTSYSPVSVTDANGCTGGLDGFVTITVNDIPSITVNSVSCSTDLNTYSVALTTNGDHVVASLGNVIFNEPSSYTITEIPLGLSLTITAENTASGCQVQQSVNAPDCSCPAIDSPVAGSNQEICQGEAISALTVSVGENQTADWYDAPSGGTLLATGTTAYVPAGAGLFYAEARDVNDGCVSSVRTAMTLTIFPLPATTITGDLEFCAGSSTLLDAGAGFVAYQWSNGFEGQSQEIFEAGDYSVTATDVNGCTAVDAVTVTVVDGPGNTSLEGGGDICVGDSANLFFSIPSGAPPYTVVYSDGTTNFMVNNYSDGAPIPVSPAVTTSYSPISVTDANGCTGGLDGFVTVTVIDPPSLIVNSVSCSTDLNTYNVALTTNGDNILASLGNVIFNGPSSYTITEIPLGLSVTITAENTASGCQVQQSVNAPDCSCPAIDSPVAGPNQEICQGEAISALTVSVGENQTADWYDAPSGGTLLATGTTAFLPSEAGLFYAEARDVNNGCVSSVRTAMTLTIFPLPATAITGDLEFCAGSSTLLDAGAGFVAYQWSNGFEGQSQEIFEAGNYSVTATDVNGCTAVDTVTVTVNEAPIVTVNSLSCSIDSSTYDLDLTTNGDHVVSSLGTVLFNGPSSYTITGIPLGLNNIITAENTLSGCQVELSVISFNCGCRALDQPVSGSNQEICQGDDIPALTVSVGVNQTADWYDAPFGGDLLATGTTEYIPSEAGQYYAEARDINNGCISHMRTAMTLTVLPPPIPVITGDLAFCAGTSTTLSAEAGHSTYFWSNGSEAQSIEVFEADTYSVTVMDNNGCTGTSSIIVTEILPAVLVTANSPLCEGEDLVLQEGGGDAISWSWNGPEGAFFEEQEVIINGVSTTASGIYEVMVTDASGCTNRADVKVLVNGLPKINATSNSPICMDEDLLLTEDGGIAIDWSWSTPSGGILIEQNPIIPYDSVEEGEYTLSIVDENNCVNTATLDVSFAEGSIFESNLLVNQSACLGDTLHFIDISDTLAVISSFLWDFGDGTSSTERDPIHVYTEEGVYQVSLEAFDKECGNFSGTKEVSIHSCRRQNVFDGSAFSYLNIYPNPSAGAFTLQVELLSKMDMLIQLYNQEGKLLNSRSFNAQKLEEAYELLTSGVYFLRITTAFSTKTEKVIIQK